MMPDGSWIKIEKIEELLSNFKPKLFHPDDPRYRTHWQQLRKKMIEGIWVEQFGMYRYMPGRLGFMGVFGRFEDWTEEGNRVIITPLVRDIEWHQAYYRLECDKFSGWSEDDEYTSDILALNIDAFPNISPKRLAALYNTKGDLKKYISPRENIFKLHDRPKGLPLHYNEAVNQALIGARGGGKSYFVAIAEIAFDIIFSNNKRYVPGAVSDSKAKIEVTSGGGGKSSELLDKAKFVIDSLNNPKYKELGIWVYENGEVEPCPFYKIMTGSTGVNNKENPWINKYKAKRGNDWIKQGNGDAVTNTAYSANQKGGAQKSAGGRNTYVVHEEWGLNPLLLDAWGNNEGTISEAGYKLASQKGIGTSGNLELITFAKQIFCNPKAYKCLVFNYPEYPEDEFGFFLPTYMVDSKFKDKDGNTDVARAKAYHKDIIKEKIKNGDPPDVILNHRMNNPIEIEDMWISLGGNILPVLEAEQREKELMKGGIYKSIGTNIELFFDTNADNGVGYKIKTDANPFYNFPFDTDHKRDLEGCVRMFIHPNKLMINGQIPKDAILTLIDPYVAGEWDKGGSLGAIICIVNPKYSVYGLPGNCLAASYYGKPLGGVEKFGEISVLIHSFYGNCHNTVWYEAVRGGDTIRNAFIKRNRFLCLAHRPQFENGHWLIPTKTTQTGYIITGGNKGLGKRTLWTELNDWLLLEQELTIDGVTETKRVIERIPDIFLIRQIKEAKMDGLNVDAVSALQPISVALGEQEMKLKIKGSQSGHLAAIQNYMIKKYKK